MTTPAKPSDNGAALWTYRATLGITALLSLFATPMAYVGIAGLSSSNGDAVGLRQDFSSGDGWRLIIVALAMASVLVAINAVVSKKVEPPFPTAVPISSIVAGAAIPLLAMFLGLIL